MNWYRFAVASAVCASAVFPFAIATQVNAQNYSSTLSCARPNNSRNQAAETATCPVQPIQQVDETVPTVHSFDDPEDHAFQLFNNSYQDILFLHLIPTSSPDEVAVLGGSRALAPGRAWNVNLSRGCGYNVLVEYEDGSRNYYEGIDTCAYQGFQFR